MFCSLMKTSTRRTERLFGKYWFLMTLTWILDLPDMVFRFSDNLLRMSGFWCLILSSQASMFLFILSLHLGASGG